MTDIPGESRKSQENIPDSIVELLALCLLPNIQKYFESEQGQKEFAEWKQKQGK